MSNYNISYLSRYGCKNTSMHTIIISNKNVMIYVSSNIPSPRLEGGGWKSEFLNIKMQYNFLFFLPPPANMAIDQKPCQKVHQEDDPNDKQAWREFRPSMMLFCRCCCDDDVYRGHGFGKLAMSCGLCKCGLRAGI